MEFLEKPVPPAPEEGWAGHPAMSGPRAEGEMCCACLLPGAHLNFVPI